MWLSLRSWPVLCSIGLGMLLCNILVCSVPLASQVSVTRSLQHVLSEPYQNTIVATASLSSGQAVDDLTTQLDLAARKTAAPAVAPQAEVGLQSQDYAVNSQTLIHMRSLPDSYLTSNFTLIAGRFPSPAAIANEVVITEQTAQQLDAVVGSTVLLRVSRGGNSPSAALVPLKVAGTVEPRSTDLRDPFNAEPVEPVADNSQSIDTALTEMPIFMRIEHAIAAANPRAPATVQVMWVYQVGADKVTALNLASVQAQVEAFTQRIPLLLVRFTGTSSLYGNGLTTLQAYDNRITATQIPLLGLAIQVGIVLVWFIIAAVDLLVDREEQTISVLRSRGAYAWQFLPGLLLPLLLPALVAGLASPWIASLIVTYLPTSTPGTENTSAAGGMAGPWQLLAELKWYSAATAGILLVACIFAAYRTLAYSVVVSRRQSSGRHQPAFWRSVPLDLIASLALASIYLSYLLFIAPAAGPALYAQLAPLAVYIPIFALVAAAISLFRLLPQIGAWCISLGKRWPGVVPVLAATHLLQSQNRMRQASIFLALAVALLCFEASYQASRVQHNQEYAAFQVGSDISFPLPIATSNVLTAAEQEDRFLKIPGVQAASAGALIDIFPQVGSSAPDRILAVDASTFATVAAWRDTSSQPSMGRMLKQLTELRETAEKRRVVPAIVDTAMIAQYGLESNDQFTLDLGGVGSLPVQFQVIGRMAYFPMTPDVASGASQEYLGGMMVDFQTLAQVIPQVDPHVTAPPGYMWLETAHDPASVHRILQILAAAPYYISAPLDRFQMLADMAYDPLSSALEDVMLLGAVIALLLAAVISGQIFWNELERRALNLSTLYAIGASEWQIMAVSAAESIVQVLLAELIGILLGTFVVLATVPLLTFAQSVDTLQPAVDLLIPPPTVVIPWGSLLVGVGLSLLLLLPILMLATRIRVGRHILKTLRLNED